MSETPEEMADKIEKSLRRAAMMRVEPTKTRQELAALCRLAIVDAECVKLNRPVVGWDAPTIVDIDFAIAERDAARADLIRLGILPK